MKAFLKKLFSPVLNPFEQGEEEFLYKSSHRVILLIVGGLFLVLSAGGLAAGILFNQLGAALPILIFFAVGACCIIVGSLGSDRAVAKIWGSK